MTTAATRKQPAKKTARKSAPPRSVRFQFRGEDFEVSSETLRQVIELLR